MQHHIALSSFAQYIVSFKSAAVVAQNTVVKVIAADYWNKFTKYITQARNISILLALPLFTL